jgi:hypothetical protein
VGAAPRSSGRKPSRVVYGDLLRGSDLDAEEVPGVDDVVREKAQHGPVWVGNVEIGAIDAVVQDPAMLYAEYVATGRKSAERRERLGLKGERIEAAEVGLACAMAPIAQGDPEGAIGVDRSTPSSSKRARRNVRPATRSAEPFASGRGSTCEEPEAARMAPANARS